MAGIADKQAGPIYKKAIENAKKRPVFKALLKLERGGTGDHSETASSAKHPRASRVGRANKTGPK